LAVSTGGEAVIVVGAGVGAFDGNNDAAVLSAFGVGGGGAAEIGVTFIGARAGNGGTAVIEAREVRVAGIATEEGIAGVGAGSWEGDTGGALTFGVLSAVHNAVTSIGAGALDSDAGLPFADSVRESAAADDGIALVGAKANDRDAGIALAFSVFVAVDSCSALVGACSGL
jgi:hypothetical protein